MARNIGFYLIFKSDGNASLFEKLKIMKYVTETANTTEIGDLNLTYLLLAQRLVREDAASAMFRMGLSREVADLLGNLSLSQIVKLASSSLFLCRLRFDDQPILSALTQEGKSLPLQQAHAAIVLSGQRIDALH